MPSDVGNLKRLYDPANLRTEYEYDPLHRLTGVIENYTGRGISDENIKTTYQESGGQVVMESENGQRITGLTHQWLTAITQRGYTGTAYLQTSLDVDQLYQTSQITSSPRTEYSIQFTTSGTYTV